MSDYIERQAVIDSVKKNFKYLPGYMQATINYINDLPSADVVQARHGKWKKIGAWGRVYRCDQCGNFLDFDGVNAGRGDANFCPNCGVKMDARGEE